MAGTTIEGLLERPQQQTTEQRRMEEATARFLNGPWTEFCDAHKALLEQVQRNLHRGDCEGHGVASGFSGEAHWKIFPSSTHKFINRVNYPHLDMQAAFQMLAGHGGVRAEFANGVPVDIGLLLNTGDPADRPPSALRRIKEQPFETRLAWVVHKWDSGPSQLSKLPMPKKIRFADVDGGSLHKCRKESAGQALWRLADMVGLWREQNLERLSPEDARITADALARYKDAYRAAKAYIDEARTYLDAHHIPHDKPLDLQQFR